MDGVSKILLMMTAIPEWGTKARRAARKSKGMAEFSEHYFLAFPTNVINWEIIVISLDNDCCC